MASRNNVTGDKQQTKPATDAYRDNFDNIFKKKDEDINEYLKRKQQEEAELAKGCGTCSDCGCV